MESTFSTTLTAITALAAVLGLVWLASRAARWGGLAPRRVGGRRLEVQDVLALDGRRRLTLVRCDDRTVLLLTGGAQDVVVGWCPQQPSEISSQVSDFQRPGPGFQRPAPDVQRPGPDFPRPDGEPRG